MIKLKVTTIGSSAGIVLPKEALALLKVQKGDSVFLTESPDGVRITPYDPDFEEFDIPKSKIKKPSAKKGKGDEDFDLDEDFKDLDLFNDGADGDDDEDDF